MSKSKDKGSAFEREVVALAQSMGLDAIRMPLSGAMFGFKGDVRIEKYMGECKWWAKPISKKLYDIYWKAAEVGCKILFVKHNYGRIMAMVEAEFLFNLLKNQKKQS